MHKWQVMGCLHCEEKRMALGMIEPTPLHKLMELSGHTTMDNIVHTGSNLETVMGNIILVGDTRLKLDTFIDNLML